MGSTSNTQITPSDQGRNVSGVHSKVAESGALQMTDGSSLTLKGGMADAKISSTTGNITIGETGTANVFADTIKSLTEQNTAALSRLFSANPTPATLPNPVADLAIVPTDPATDPGGGEPTAAFYSTPGPWLVGLLALGLGWWWLKRAK